MTKFRNIFEATMAEVNYECKTTFWDDFTIADRFGVNAVKDTFKRAFNEWKTNVTFVTELVMVLNHKLWYHYERGNMELARVYDKAWREADQWCGENLKGEDAKYYFSTTD